MTRAVVAHSPVSHHLSDAVNCCCAGDTGAVAKTPLINDAKQNWMLQTTRSLKRRTSVCNVTSVVGMSTQQNDWCSQQAVDSVCSDALWPDNDVCIGPVSEWWSFACVVYHLWPTSLSVHDTTVHHAQTIHAVHGWWCQVLAWSSSRSNNFSLWM